MDQTNIPIPRRFNVYARLAGYLRPYPFQVGVAYTGMVFAALLNLFVPQIIKNAIDNGLAAGQAFLHPASDRPQAAGTGGNVF